MINGFHILYFALGLLTTVYILGKIRLLKQEVRFWKESCFITAERYNNLLVKRSMDIALDKTFNNDRLKLN